MKRSIEKLSEKSRNYILDKNWPVCIILSLFISDTLTDRMLDKSNRGKQKVRTVMILALTGTN